MRFNEKEGRARRVVFIFAERHEKKAQRATIVAPALPTAREGEGNGGQPAKQIPSTKIVPSRTMQPQRAKSERPAMKLLK
jgi:hypothetical protein